MDNDNAVEVADKLFNELRPNSEMSVTSLGCSIVEKWRIEWLQSNENISLYDWIKQNKKLK